MRRIIVEIRDPGRLFGLTEDALHSFWSQMFKLRSDYSDITLDIQWSHLESK